MLWKLYFWTILIFTIIGIIGYSGLESWNLASWIEIISGILGVVGLYSYVYKKKLLSKRFWRIFFWIVIISTLFNFIYVFTPLEENLKLPSWIMNQMGLGQVELTLGTILTLPMFYGIYIISEDKT